MDAAPHVLVDDDHREIREPLAAGTYRFDRWSLDAGRRELVDEAGAVTPLSSGELRLLVACSSVPGWCSRATSCST